MRFEYFFIRSIAFICSFISFIQATRKMQLGASVVNRIHGLAPPIYVYDKDGFQLIVYSTDQDNDRIRYGISLDNEVVDEYTNYYESVEKARINCIGHKKPVYVIAEDEHGGQSHWVKAKGNISKDTLLNLLKKQLLYRLGERFPILEQILQPIYVYLG